MRNNNKGVSAVIGVILMVAVTMATSVTVYVYVRTSIDSYDRNLQDLDDGWKYSNVTGELRGLWNTGEETGYKYTVIIDNTTLERVKFSPSERDYLGLLIGENVTLILLERTADSIFSWQTGDYDYVGAYLME